MSTDSPQFIDYQHGYMSMSMGTSDLHHHPDFARVWGARLSDDQTQLTLLLPKAVGTRAMANLEVNKRIAVNIADVSNFITQQFKGEVIEIREATSEEIAIAKESRDKTVPILSQFFGELGANWGRFKLHPSWTIVISVKEVYNQTPGKMAGMKIL
jgi:hypothetical protein